MGILRNYITKIVRCEAEKMLLDKKYLDLVKEHIQNDTEQRRVNSNDEYLESLRK